mgnify:CR=1 FL=1
MNNQYLEIAILASLNAGKAIDKVYNDSKHIEVITKADNSPLTIADKLAHNIIIEHLEELDLPVLSEEGDEIDWEIRKQWSLFWLIDPLDGTKEFINRNGEFTVNIALIKDGAPILGVVYLPVTKELYYGGITMGAFKKIVSKEDDVLSIIEKSTKLLPGKQESNVFRIIVSKSHMTKETESIIEECKQVYKNVELVSCGSSKKLCLLAEDKVNLYPRIAPTMEWDTAAAHAIVIASGKRVVDFNSNSELIYNKENLLNPSFIAYDSKYHFE